MRDLYERLRRLDDGLVHISQTPLLSPELWRTDDCRWPDDGRASRE